MLVKRRTATVVAGLLVASGLAACGNSAGTTSSSTLPSVLPSASSSTVPAKYVNGGTFVIALAVDPGSLNPFTNNSFFGNPYFPTALAYDTLISETAEGKVEPLLAQSWTASTTRASFVLRSGITCSDGAPLKASDVAADINYVGDANNKSVLTGQYVQAGSKATADDASRTVTVASGAGDPFLLQNLGSLPIVCAKGLTDQKMLDAHTDGTGLFKITSVQPGSSYTLQRRKDYAWGPGDWKNNQPGLPDQINYRVITNTTTMANLLVAGQANFGIAAKPEDAARLSGLFKQAELLPEGVFLFNEASGHPTADPVVRKALVQALDLGQLGQVIGGGLGQATKQLNTYFLPNLCPGDTTSGNLPSHDVAAAKAALDKDGWVAGSSGTRTKDGKPLQIQFPVISSFQPFVSASELMRQQLQAIGVDLVVKPVNNTNYGEVITNGSFDLLLQSWTFPTPSGMVSSYTGQPISAGGNNIGDVHNSEYDQLVAQASKKAGTAGCSLWNQAESALIKRVDVAPFWSVPDYAYGSHAIFDLVQFTWSIRMTAD
jgi:peptide/nickel transport system substrate-binding protein